MKKITKVLTLALALVMLVGAFAACGKKGGLSKEDAKLPSSSRVEVVLDTGKKDTGKVKVDMNLDLVKDADFAEYADWETYKAVLGDYYKYLLAAKAQTDVSAKYAVMAIAEAKLLEAGVMLPTTTQGGVYALSRVAPNTGNNALWGVDSDRYENLVVATEFIKASDRDVMKAKYIELKGTAKYEAWAKKYLQDQGYTLKDTYTLGYSSEPTTWDILDTYRAADTEHIILTQEALLSYDCEGRLTYALANNVTVSDDGLTYTFTLRDGLKWVTQNGEEYADIKAQDFVDGMQRLLDLQAGLETLPFGVIKNAEEYYDGKVEFSSVGVKAVDDKTLQYTLEQPTSYFLTMLEYNPFMPVCKEYVDAQGEAYGTDDSHILYSGPYIVTNHTPDNKIVYSANEAYWDAANINIKTLTYLYYGSGSDVTKTYQDAKAGVIDGASLNTTTLQMAKDDGLFNDYAYVSSTNATTYSAFMNIKRGSYSTEGYGMASQQTDAQKTATAKAVLNQHFRLAVLQAVDRAAYNAADVGEDVKVFSVRNMYTPGTFVTLTRDVEIQIGDKKTTFKEGTYYGEIVQAQLDADGYSIKVWDPKGGDGDGSSDGFDGWYNKDTAVAELNKAIAELSDLNISADNPIVLDLPYWSARSNYTAKAQAFKKSVEETLGGKVVVNLVGTDNVYGWYFAGYYCDYGEECNYDLYDCSGWGPDYGDPSTYLNTFQPNGGDMIHVLGID